MLVVFWKPISYAGFMGFFCKTSSYAWFVRLRDRVALEATPDRIKSLYIFVLGL